MDFRNIKGDLPSDYIPIEEHIRRAKLERSVVIAQLLADAIGSIGRGLRGMAASIAGARLGPVPVPKRAATR